MVERRRPQVWDVLEEAIKEHPVLLNRAPTLHRLGIQAFEPVLVEGKAIQIHPLVCTAFNADFDGDQMAVHLPLSSEAQAESRVLMLSANNVLSPAHGRPLVTPTQDMIIGAFYLTESVDGGKGEGRSFRHLHEVERAYEAGDLDLHSLISFRGPINGHEPPAVDDESVEGLTRGIETTAGRLFFNNALPEGFELIERRVDKRIMSNIVDVLASEYPKGVVADSLDKVKNLCFRYAAKSGITISVEDVKTPVEKAGILEDHEAQAQKVEDQFRKGIITDGERRQKEVEIWTDATDQVRAAMEKSLKAQQFNPIEMMVGSGARGNMMQVRQIAGMRGLVANPRGDMIPRPIKSNFREGLEMLEYFIATPGARKGLVDTALRTADSGYLTRRLVDVAQELIINEEDPFAKADATGSPIRGIYVEDIWPDGFFSTDGTYVGSRPKEATDKMRRTYLETRLFSRTLANDVKLSDGTTVAKGTVVDQELMEQLRDDPEVNRVRVLSPLTDDSAAGISGASYGMSLATGKAIEVGEAVGVIAAQSIGEPGTQLTMRTFHTGGIAGSDIAGGLPRVVELFEARTPKGKATLARTSGVVRVGEDEGRGRVVTVVSDEGDEDTYTVPSLARLEVKDGDEIEAGDPIVEGARDPKELLEISGVRETQQYLVEQVQKVYREQGVSIHDKHIELIVRQMTRRVIVLEPNESEFLPGERVDQKVFADANKLLVEEGKKPAEGRVELMGITKASLATDSWLSAASFQETTRVLTEAAIDSRSDSLLGLKENIIIGKLIPAGTGMNTYRDIDTYAPDYQPMAYYSSDDNEVDPSEWLANLGNGDGDGAAAAGDAEVIGITPEARTTAEG